MASFVPKTYEDILQRLVNRVVARSTLTDLTETAAGKTLLAAVAREADDLYYALVNILATFAIDTAAGQDLDDRAADFNITRKTATKATGALVFARTGTAGLVPIPAGVRVNVPGQNPELVAVTTAIGSIADLSSTSAPVAAVMEKAGSRGNVAIGTLIGFKSGKPPGVNSVSNPNPFGAGQDTETDDAFRARIKLFIATLARSTVAALEFVSSGVSIVSGKRVVFSKVVEDPVVLGKVYLYIDDGAGTAVETDDTGGVPEVLTSGVDFPGDVAQGGEQYLYTDNFPIDESASFVVVANPWQGAPGPVTLVRDVDYTLNAASGQLFFPVPLVAADKVTDEYTWYINLVKEVQKVVDGDPADRTNYPGWRAAGVLVLVRAPTIVNVVVSAGVTVTDAFVGVRASVLSAVQTAIAAYINGIGIGGDVVLAEMIQRAMEVPGVFDVTFFAPLGNLSVLPDQLPRTNAATDVTVT